jgi:hypothetical protein
MPKLIVKFGVKKQLLLLAKLQHNRDVVLYATAFLCSCCSTAISARRGKHNGLTK